NLFSGGDVVIVRDRVAVLRNIDQLVSDVDVPPLQADIEAVILSVEHDHDQEVGVNFAIADSTGNLLGGFGDGSKLDATVGFVPGLPFKVGSTLTTGSTGTSSQGGAVQGSGFLTTDHGLKFGATRGGVTTLIKMLKATGKVEILARPHLLVLNNQ